MTEHQKGSLEWWKQMSRKHERQAKLARKLIQKLAAEVTVPSDTPPTLADIEAELERIYSEKRKITTGVGEPFRSPVPRDDLMAEVIVARRSRKQTGPAIPTSQPAVPSDGPR